MEESASQFFKNNLYHAPPEAPKMIEKHPTTIRKLTPTDAPHYRDFRLYALRRYPLAFGSDYNDESAKPLSFYGGRIAAKESPDDFLLGAFDGQNTLIGTVGFARSARRSERHKATLYGMAVREDCSGRGIGKALVDAFIAEARNVPGLLQIMLSVTDSNEPAKRLGSYWVSG
jgi:ribosomal protein S18 acetylase RimI-like enzyme